MPVTFTLSRVTQLRTDTDNDGVADAGDILRNILTIQNTGSSNATNVVLNDLLGGSTLTGTVNVSPIAFNDSFTAIGNTLLLVGGATGTGPASTVSGNILSNDSEFLGDTFVLNTVTNGTSAQGGHFTLNADGSFSYISAAGFTGTDTFTYTIHDKGLDGVSGNADDLSSTATVSITVANRVWYVDTSAATNGDGTSTNPFNTVTLTNLNGTGGAGDVDAAGDYIYVKNSANLTTNLNLEAGEHLIGSGVALVVGGFTLATASTNSTLTNTSGTIVTLSTDNDVQGITFNSNGAGVVGLADGNGSVTTAAGTFNASHISFTGSGQAVDIDQGGNLNVQIDSLTSSGSNAEGVQLAGTATSGTGLLSGTFSVTTGAISGSTGTGFRVGDGTAGHGGTVTVTDGGTIAKSSSGAAVLVEGHTANAVTFSGTVTATGSAGGVNVNANAGGSVVFSNTVNASGTGIGASVSNNSNGTAVTFSGANDVFNTGAANGVSLSSNTGATVNFTGGGLNIDTTTGVGFSATGGGTVNVTGANNSIASVSATALNVTATTIGASGLIFHDISSGNNTAASDPVNGIILNTTGSSGGLTVTGDAGSANNGSGGLIQNTSGAGILLTATRDVSFDQLNISGTGGSGVQGTQVTNFAHTNSTFTNDGNAFNESGIAFNDSDNVNTGVGDTGQSVGNNISGTLTVTGNTFINPFYSALDVQSDNGTVTQANVSNNTITNPGFAGVNFAGIGNASTAFNLNDADINNNVITSTGAVGIQVSISNANASGPGAHAGFVTIDAQGRPVSDPNHIISIVGNLITVDGTGTQAITVANGGGNSASRTQTNFEILNNGTAANPLDGSDIGTVILVGNNGFSDMAGVIDNNIIDPNHTPNGGGGNGIAGGNGVSGAGNAWTPRISLIVTNNDISRTDGNGILLVGRSTSGQAYFKVANNTVDAPVNVGGTAREGIRIDAGNAASGDDAVYLNIFGNTSAGSNTASGIGLRKQGSVATTNDFGIFDAAGGPTLAATPTNTDITNFVNALNPNSATGGGFGTGGTDIISGSNFVRDTTLAPLLASSAPPPTVPNVGPSDQVATGAQSTPAVASSDQAIVDGATMSLGEMSQAVHRWAMAEASIEDLATLRNLHFAGHLQRDPTIGATASEQVASTPPSTPNGPVVVDDGILSQAELNLVIDAAINRWAAAGVSAEELAAMRAVTFTIEDMQGLVLGSSTAGHITLDSNAAGFSWFIDATPGDDSEYSGLGTALHADPATAAGMRIDLLTTIVHELGHQIGLGDLSGADNRSDVMYGTINPGERRLPDGHDVAAATGTPVMGTDFALSPVNIGTIPAGQTVVVMWDSTVNAFVNQIVPTFNNSSTITYSDGPTNGLTATSNVQVLSPTSTLALDSVTLGDRVFLDLNNNGLFDGADTGINGVTLTLFADTNGNGTFDAGTDTQIATTTTAGGGLYSFANLAPGDYIVRVDASNFSGAGVLAGRAAATGGSDPDNNTNNDSNGVVSGTLGTGGFVVSQAITLSQNGETTADATGKLDINNSLDFGFVAQNQAPVNSVPGATQTLNEDATKVFSTGNGNAISVSDVDVGAGNLTVTLAVTHGVLTLSGIAGLSFATGDGTADATMTFSGTVAAINTALNGLIYAPTADYNGAATLTITTNDNGNTGADPGLTGGPNDEQDVDTVTFSITAINDAPVVAGDGTETVTGSNEDSPTAGVTINSLLAGQYSDAADNQIPNGGASSPGAFSGVAITGNGSSAATGQWQYLNGVTWINIGAASNASAVLLANTTQIRFNPAADFNGPAPTLTVHLVDNSLGFGIVDGQHVDISAIGATGGTTAYSTGTVVIDTSIAAVNDAPVNTVPLATQTLAEDATKVFSSGNGNQISVADVDAGAGNLTVTISVLHGTLTLSGIAGLSFGSGDGTADATMTFTGTAAAINTALNGLSYAPIADYNGADTLTINTSDNGNTGTPGALQDNDTVAISITAVVDIANDTLTFNEDSGPQTLSMPNNDTFENPGRSITAVTQGAHGTVTINDNGTVGNTTDDFIVYTQTADYNGTDSFTYTVTSGGVTETATVNVVINAVADIASDNATTAEDTAVNVLVLGNDTFEGTPSITSIGAAAHGTAVLNNNGTVGNTADDYIVYTPNADYNGTDSFTYTVTSGGVTETTTVTMTITAVADIADDNVTVVQNSGANTLNLLANDTFESAARFISAVTQGAHGTVAINNNGTPGNTADDFVTYAPAAGYAGPDSFTYTVTSGGVTETATVNVTVGPLNATPVLDLNGAAAGIDNSASYIENAATVSLAPALTVADSNDTNLESASVKISAGFIAAADFLRVNGATTGTIGAISFSYSAATGILSLTGSDTLANYQAVLRQVGFDSTSDNPGTSRTIVWTVNDGDIDSGVATTALTVTPVDDPAVAKPDAVTTDEATVLSGNVFSNNGSGPDTDVDGPALSVSAVNGVAGNVGTQIALASGALLKLNANGTFTYDPNHAFDATPTAGSGASNTPAHDSFTYTLAGGGTATVSVTINGIDTNDVLIGTAGADVLNGGVGNDTMSGGTGNDTYYVDSAGDIVIEAAGEGSDRVAASTSYSLAAGTEVETIEAITLSDVTSLNLAGNEIANRILGNNGANFLSGGGGDDVLFGLGGDDVLFGGAGNDAMSGGAGNDTYYVDSAGDLVNEAAGEGLDRIAASVSYTLDASTQVELLEAITQSATSALDLTGNSFDNTIIGNNGANILKGGGGSDVLFGLGGDDTLDGGAGADVMSGGTGNDTYYVDSGGDIVNEAAGEGMDQIATSVSYTLDTSTNVEVLYAVDLNSTTPINLTGNELANTLIGNEGANVLSGGGGADILRSGGGNDVLIGGVGDDTMFGGNGNDTYYVDSIGDVVTELAGAGIDRVATTVSYTLVAGSEVEKLEAIDQSAATAIDLIGNEFANAIAGNAGANMIDGKGGSDLLQGGLGADTFAFTTALGASNVDAISDFVSGTDKIALDDAIFTAIGGLGALNSNAFFVGTAAHDADDRIIYDAATGNLYYDADGNGNISAVLFATLNGQPPVTASDFSVI